VSEDGLKKAFRSLAKKYHPDKNQNIKDTVLKEQSDQMFQEVNHAYNVLSDPKKRQLFDAGIDPEDPNAGNSSNLKYFTK